jgi:DNA-binding transcriptional regulator GbsR (MarR family)
MFFCTQMQAAPAKLETNEEPLSGLEVESIELFIGFFKLIGLQKSIGEIYGLLFVSPRALSMEESIDRLGISLGAASQGLKVLRSVGAVKSVYTPGDRRDHYVADLELSKFASAFIQEELKPRLDRSLERIGTMQNLANGMKPEDRSAAWERLERLKHWLERGESMLPWLLKFLVK